MPQGLTQRHEASPTGAHDLRPLQQQEGTSAWVFAVFVSTSACVFAVFMLTSACVLAVFVLTSAWVLAVFVSTSAWVFAVFVPTWKCALCVCVCVCVHWPVLRAVTPQAPQRLLHCGENRGMGRDGLEGLCAVMAYMLAQGGGLPQGQGPPWLSGMLLHQCREGGSCTAQDTAHALRRTRLMHCAGHGAEAAAPAGLVAHAPAVPLQTPASALWGPWHPAPTPPARAART